jgi:O-antigen ligase
MRAIARVLLLLFVFTIPWEYSLDLGEPWGNVARIAGLLLLLAAVPAALQKGSVRAPGPVQWMVMTLYLWFCCTYFWTVAPQETLISLRGFFQKMMIVWLVWEFAETPLDLRALLRAAVAGSAVLALLTLADFRSAEAVLTSQTRFAAVGQDPNDVAAFLDLGFPLAALLTVCEPHRWSRRLAMAYLPLGLAAVLLTASRGGFLGSLVALGGSALLLYRTYPRRTLIGALALPIMAAALWFIVPMENFERLATIPEQLHGGTLNERWKIWHAGWQAFRHAPLFGFGAGSFVSAAGLSAEDTAHNAALAIAVSGGLVAFLLAVVIVVLIFRSLRHIQGILFLAMATSLAVWLTSSLVATVEQSRATWLLLALIALAGRMAVDVPVHLSTTFTPQSPTR